MLAPDQTPRYAWPRSLASRELLVAGGLTAIVAALLLALGPAPGDEPAHLYRTLLVERGAFFWDELWYAGHYPPAYSVLYYLPAAVVGNLPLVVAASVASAALFASICLHEWGPAARWPARIGAVAMAAPLFTGLFSYSVGLATLLGTIRALQAGRRGLAVLLALLTLGFSPLAFAFLCLVLVAVVVSRRGIGTRALQLGFVLVAGVQVALLVLFPGAGVHPFSLVNLLPALGVCALGAALAWQSPAGRTLAVLFVLWGVACLVFFVIPSPVGDNVTRLRGLVFPVMLLAAMFAHFRPRWLAILALAGAFAYNIVPYLLLIPYRTDGRVEKAAFWQPALSYLEQHADPDYRVEVVPTGAHWESYWVPKAGFSLARGWYRQLDVAESPELYRDELTPEAYRAWLDRMAVRWVLLPNTPLDEQGGPMERELLLSGRSGLVEVWRSDDWRIYLVPRAVPILTGPGRADITYMGHDRIAAWATEPGTYLLRVRYSRYWQPTGSATCVAKAPGGLTYVTLATAGAFALDVPEDLGGLVESLGGNGPC